MFRGRIVCLFIVAAMLVGATTASAQDEKKWGLGVDMQNQGFELLGFSALGTPFFTLSHTSLTPAFLLSFRTSPNLFIEPSFGWHKSSEEIEDTVANQLNKITQQDIRFGLGVLFLTNPTEFVSPYFRLNFDVHLLKAEEEDDVTFPSAGTDVMEVSATALVFAGSVGGIINIKESVFITLEARLLYASVGDTDDKRSGPGYPSFTDTVDTKSTRFATDMTVGLRFLFF